MADEIAGAFQQGVIQLQGRKTTVALSFTKPDNAQNIEINFFEVNSWVSNGLTVTESNAPPRLLGTTGGFIAHKKYTETSQAIPFPHEGAKQLLTVNIDGNEVTMPLPHPNHDIELDFFEVTFTVTGKVGGVAASYQSPSPLFVRNTPTPRAELAVIAGDGSEFPDDPSTIKYFQVAEDFWNNLRDNKRTKQLSIQAIFDYLRDNADDAVRLRNNLPFGRINIVSHGDDGWNGTTGTFEATWYIRAKDGDDISQDFGFTATQLASAEVGVGPPRRQEVDEHTDIIIRGCVIGNDVKLLNAIRAKFGGLATVYAPKFTNSYRVEKGVPRDRLFDVWDVSLKGNAAFPDRATLKGLLKTRYQKHPRYGSFTDSDWDSVAGITESFAGGANQFRQRIVDRTGEQSADCDEAEVKSPNPKTGKLETKNQADLTTLMRGKVQLSAAEFNRWDWHWRVTPPKVKDGFFLVAGTGTRTNLEIFRILTAAGADGKSVPVTPDYKNPTQFGQSS